MKHYIVNEFACSNNDKLLYLGCKGVATNSDTALGIAFKYIYTKYTHNNNVVQIINYFVNEIGVGDIEFAFTTSEKPIKEQQDLLYDVKNRNILRIELVEMDHE